MRAVAKRFEKKNKFYGTWEKIKKMSRRQTSVDHKVAKLVEEQESKPIDYHQRENDYKIFSLAQKSYSTSDLIGYFIALFKSEHVVNLYVPNNGTCGCSDEGVSAHNSFLILKGKPVYAFGTGPEYELVLKALDILGLKDVMVSEDYKDFLPKQAYLKVLKGMKEEGKMKKLFWHRGCGAAGIDYRRLVRITLDRHSDEEIFKAAERLLYFSEGREKCMNFLVDRLMKLVKPSDIDVHAENLYKALGKHFDVEVACFEHMKRPLSIHPSKGLFIFVDEGKYIIEPEMVQFPLFYTLSSHITTLKKIPKRMNVLLSIVFSPHGAWGLGMVSEANKFLIAIVLHPSMKSQEDEIRLKIEEAIPHKYKKYIEVKVFIPYEGKAEAFDAALAAKWSVTV